MQTTRESLTLKAATLALPAGAQPGHGLGVPLALLAVLLLRGLAVVVLLAPLVLAAAWLLR